MMYKVADIGLNDDGRKIEDVEIWADSAAEIEKGTFTSSYSRVPIDINYKQIPLCLLQQRRFVTYSNDVKTTKFFESNLVSQSNGGQGGLGMLYRNEVDSHLVFYFHRDSGQIRCLSIDFRRIKKHRSQVEENFVLRSLNTNIFVDQWTRTPNVSVFDKVLQKKRSVSTPFLTDPININTPLSSSKLTTTEQINRAVNKVILSGLRIRGLSTNSTQNTNDKLAIKEIHQMTSKATQFSLRKFNYSFNGSKNCSVKLDEIQDIVERLLEVFVDVNDVGTSRIPSSK